MTTLAVVLIVTGLLGMMLHHASPKQVQPQIVLLVKEPETPPTGAGPALLALIIFGLLVVLVIQA